MNLCKAAVAVAAAPVLAVADVLTLPCSAYEGGHPFSRARGALRAAGRAFGEAVKADAATEKNHD